MVFRGMLTVMITPSHLIYNWALGTKLQLARIEKTGLIIGGFLPDLPTYVFFMVHTFIIGSSQQAMWDNLYFDSAWTPIITLSHSFILWPILVLIGHWCRFRLLKWVALGSLFHASLDFLVHNDDAYRHFWPLTEWKFMSPISYWDPNHYGHIVGALDTIIIFGLLYFLMRQTTARRTRLLIVGLATLYLMATILPYFIFN